LGHRGPAPVDHVAVEGYEPSQQPQLTQMERLGDFILTHELRRGLV